MQQATKCIVCSGIWQEKEEEKDKKTPSGEVASRAKKELVA
jgi:hypothetical protein